MHRQTVFKFWGKPGRTFLPASLLASRATAALIPVALRESARPSPRSRHRAERRRIQRRPSAPCSPSALPAHGCGPCPSSFAA